MVSNNEGIGSAKRVLVVDDEEAVRQMIAFQLSRHGFSVALASDARAAKVSLDSHHPDLALVDWMLPGISGLDLTRSIKQASGTRHLPVIILTARTDEQDKIFGLESGADDYMTKPFSTPELLARINALLRRASRRGIGGTPHAADLILDPEGRRVISGERSASLGPTAFRLLSFLMAHPERLHTRSQLLDRVWGAHTEHDVRTVDVEISRLRRVLDRFQGVLYIQTVQGAGYRFSTRTDGRSARRASAAAE